MNGHLLQAAGIGMGHMHRLLHSRSELHIDHSFNTFNIDGSFFQLFTYRVLGCWSCIHILSLFQTKRGPPKTWDELIIHDSMDADSHPKNRSLLQNTPDSTGTPRNYFCETDP